MHFDSVLTSLAGLGARRQPLAPRNDGMFWSGRDGQLGVQHFRPEANVSYPPHADSEYTLVVCLAGEARFKQLGQESVIGWGEAAMCNHGVIYASAYRFRDARAGEALCVSVDRRFLEALTGDFPKLPWKAGTCPAFLGKVEHPGLLVRALKIAEELDGLKAGRNIVLETQAIGLLVEALRLWPPVGICEQMLDATPRLSRGEFMRAYAFMSSCRKEDFRLHFLCRHLGSSEERFTRLFLASTEQSPASFYNRLLMERACGLLANPDLSVKEIAFELGFRTSSHFVTAFRRVRSATPQKYREQMVA